MFYVLLLKQNSTRKRQIDKKIPKFDVGNNKKQKVGKKQENIVYTKKLKAQN